MTKQSKCITFEFSSEDRKVFMKANKILQTIMNEMSIDDYLYVSDEPQYNAYSNAFSHHDLCVIGQFLIQLRDCETLKIK